MEQDQNSWNVATSHVSTRTDWSCRRSNPWHLRLKVLVWRVAWDHGELLPVWVGDSDLSGQGSDSAEDLLQRLDLPSISKVHPGEGGSSLLWQPNFGTLTPGNRLLLLLLWPSAKPVWKSLCRFQLVLILNLFYMPDFCQITARALDCWIYFKFLLLFHYS